MVRDKLKKYYSDRCFFGVDLHTPEMDLYYIPDGQSVSMVWIISEEAGKTMYREAYLRYMGKIRQSFLDRNYSFVNILTLFLSSECKRMAEIAEGTAFWVVDEKYGRLVIYENQPSDFLGSRLAIEQFVSFMTAERVSEAQRINQQSEEAFFREAHAEAGRPYKYEKRPYVVYGIILINVAILLLVNLLGNVLGTAHWQDEGANWWMAVVEDGQYYRLITCMFLHADVDHIFGNMIMLFAVGEILERKIGHVKFAILYMIGGIVGSVTSCMYYYSINEYAQSIGASGAVFAVVGGLIMYIILNKENILDVGMGRIVIFALYSLYSGFISEGIDNAAHIGGLIGGSLVYLVIYVLEYFAKRRKQYG